METERSENYIQSKDVRARYGNVSHMWIERRLKDQSGFPQPMKVGKRRFWKIGDLEKWEKSQIVK